MKVVDYQEICDHTMREVCSTLVDYWLSYNRKKHFCLLIPIGVVEGAPLGEGPRTARLRRFLRTMAYQVVHKF